MKKIIVLFMAVTLCASLAGCGKERKVINENDIAQAVSGLSEKAENSAENTVGNSSTNKKYEEAKIDVTNCLASLSVADINIKSYAVLNGYSNNRYIAIAADFTNKTDMDGCMFNHHFPSQGICGIKAYQNGVQLDVGDYFMYRSSYIEKDLETPIKPGKTLEVMFSVWLRNEEEDVELEFYDGRSDFDDRYYHDGRHYNNDSPETTTCTIKLSK